MDDEKLIAKLIVAPDEGLMNVLGVYGVFHSKEMREFLECSEDSALYMEDVKKEILSRFGDAPAFYIVKCELNYVSAEYFGPGISEFNPAYYHIGNIIEITRENFESTELPSAAGAV